MTNQEFSEYITEIKKYLKNKNADENLLKKQEKHLAEPMIDDARRDIAVKCWLYGEDWTKIFIEGVQQGKDPYVKYSNHDKTRT